MARSAHKSKSRSHAADEATLAHTLAPEEIRSGDHVAVLYEVVEFPSWYWCDDSQLAPRDQVVPMRCLPRDEPYPMKVRGVCLPFVFVRQPCGAERTLDVRRHRLARLHAAYAATAWKAYRKAAKKRRCEKSDSDANSA